VSGSSSSVPLTGNWLASEIMSASATTVTSGSLRAAMNFPTTGTAGRPVAHAHPRRPAGAQGAGTHLPGGPADGPQLADLGIDKAAAEAHITAAVAAALAVREQKQQAGRRSGLPGYPGVSHRGSRRSNLQATPT
jgi:hypothetical protein